MQIDNGSIGLDDIHFLMAKRYDLVPLDLYTALRWMLSRWKDVIVGYWLVVFCDGIQFL